MNRERWKITIRVYTPDEPFHEQRSYVVRRRNGDMWAQVYLFGWAVMFGFSKWSGAMPFFMIVGRKDNET